VKRFYLYHFKKNNKIKISKTKMNLQVLKENAFVVKTLTFKIEE